MGRAVCAPSLALSCTRARGKRARLLSALSALQPGGCPGPWPPRIHTCCPLRMGGSGGAIASISGFPTLPPEPPRCCAGAGRRRPARPPRRRVLGEGGARDPPRPPPGGPQAGAGPAGRWCSPPRAGPCVARQRLRGSGGGGAARPACSGPSPRIRPGPPPPRRPRCAPVRGSQSPPQRPPASRARARPRREAGVPGSRRVAMEREPRAKVALVPGRSGRGPSSRHRRPGLLLPGLWLLLLARPASCAPGKLRRAPRDAAATLPAFAAALATLCLPPAPHPPILFYSPPLPRPPCWRCFSILPGPSK